MPNNKTIVLAKTAAEIEASNVTPQVRAWLMEIIGEVQHQAAATSAHDRALSAHAVELRGLDRALGEIDAARLAAQEINNVAADLGPQVERLIATFTPGDDARADALTEYGEDLEWLARERAFLGKLQSFLGPLLEGAQPPLDGAQIPTRAMLDRQIQKLSVTLREHVDKSIESLRSNLDTLQRHDVHSLSRRLDQLEAEMKRDALAHLDQIREVALGAITSIEARQTRLESAIDAALRPAALLKRLLATIAFGRRGQ